MPAERSSASPPAGESGAGAGHPEVVFVGGTGRSGTHVLARLLGCHSHLADVPIEARFHCNKRGLPELLGGRVPLAGYLEKLRQLWWHRVRSDGQPRGLYNLMRRGAFDDAVARFEVSYHDDPIVASRILFFDLLAPVAARAGKPGLVEMSSHNLRAAQTLCRLFPGARFIHAVRDGRDSASSVTTKSWGPQTIGQAIDWWADRLRRIEQGVRGEQDGAAYVIPPERFRVVVLDDLVEGDREHGYASLLSFLGLGDEPGVRSFFEERMRPGAAHRGRWSEGLSTLGRARVRRKYERTLRELDREDNHVAPHLLESYGRLEPPGRWRGRIPGAN